jgi:hypothetical protein
MELRKSVGMILKCLNDRDKIRNYFREIKLIHFLLRFSKESIYKYILLEFLYLFYLEIEYTIALKNRSYRLSSMDEFNVEKYIIECRKELLTTC